MPTNTDLAAKTIAIVRILTGGIFLFFGQYKIASPAFAYGGFEEWIRDFLAQDMPVSFMKPVLLRIALAHPVLCARIVGWGELAIGLSLVLGLLVRVASIGGAVEMIFLALSTWYAPGRHAPTWRYFGANLDHIPLLFLFAIFFAANAGTTWGLDGIRARRSASSTRRT